MRLLVHRRLRSHLQQRDSGTGLQAGPARSYRQMLSLPSVTKAPLSSLSQASGLTDSPGVTQNQQQPPSPHKVSLHTGTYFQTPKSLIFTTFLDFWPRAQLPHHKQTPLPSYPLAAPLWSLHFQGFQGTQNSPFQWAGFSKANTHYKTQIGNNCFTIKGNE